MAHKDGGSSSRLHVAEKPVCIIGSNQGLLSWQGFLLHPEEQLEKPAWMSGIQHRAVSGIIKADNAFVMASALTTRRHPASYAHWQRYLGESVSGPWPSLKF